MDAAGLIPSFIGAPLADRDGVVTGTVEDVLFDERTHRPVWVLLRFAGEASAFTFVPADRLSSRRDAVAVPFGADEIRSAPVRLPAPAEAAREHAVQLCRHYGVRLPAATWAASAHPVRPAPAQRQAPAFAVAS